MNLDLLQTALEQFHFIRPDWLWGLPAAFILWFALKDHVNGQQWSSHIPKEMLAALQTSTAKQPAWWKWCLLSLWLGMITAAAGPTWNKQAAPTMQNQNALVLILDLSPSMLIQDLSPDRLTRAKYKLIDVLRHQDDGQVALIAYAGGAHTVSPLTDDPRTIEALLPALHPSIMPSNGSNTEAAIALAQQLLRDSNVRSGDILLITDGVFDEAIDTIRASINPNYRVSIMAAGGLEAAPIPSPDGGFIRNRNGEIVLSAVNASSLRSMATSLGGRFSMLTVDDTDIRALLMNEIDIRNSEETQQSDVEYDAWVDMGHWLVLLLLPLALLLFRKGILYALPLSMPFLFLAPNDAYAASFAWQDLWKTKDQQAAEQFESGAFEAAASNFKRKDWSALANYKSGQYQQAIEQLNEFDDITSRYNKGNALAFNGQFEEAIQEYEHVLAQAPNHIDAAHNKSVIEQLLKQQQEQEQQDQNSEGSPESESSESESQDEQGESQQQGDSSESNSAQSQDQQESQDPSEKQADAEQNSHENEADEQKTNVQEQAGEESDEKPDSEQTSTTTQTDSTDTPLKSTSEQWLRSIQDDPSGLLRRKFDYQARQRAQQEGQDNAVQERY